MEIIHQVRPPSPTLSPLPMNKTRSNDIIMKVSQTITALLEQSDPGARLLAYLALGSPDFTKSPDDYLFGKLARKASSTSPPNSTPISPPSPSSLVKTHSHNTSLTLTIPSIMIPPLSTMRKALRNTRTRRGITYTLYLSTPSSPRSLVKLLPVGCLLSSSY